jgi:tRNA 2-(methylsulfanyl)-N6-isopentenyladenosine37 hydroxylase
MTLSELARGVPLLAATPDAWYAAASNQLDVLLVDHANCEKKAASTALGLMFSYADDSALGLALARLAREELRHYEQVVALMDRLGVPYARLSPSRYAGGLRTQMVNHEPDRRLDLLLVGALIEARSAERFHGLLPHLPAEIATFYQGLAAAEARHMNLYERLAIDYAQREGLNWTARLQVLAECEADLITRPDTEFRFHSGPPR